MMFDYPKCTKKSDCGNAQADLNIRWTNMPEGTFSDVARQIHPYFGKYQESICCVYSLEAPM